MRSHLRPVVIVAAAAATLVAAGTAAATSVPPTEPPAGTDTTAAAGATESTAPVGTIPDPAACAEGLTLEDGVLTVATGEPAFPPYVIDDDPESGEGFEAAVAYAVADQMGFAHDDVAWVRTPFDAAIQPGPKDFDFNLQQFSITPGARRGRLVQRALLHGHAGDRRRPGLAGRRRDDACRSCRTSASVSPPARRAWCSPRT